MAPSPHQDSPLAEKLAEKYEPFVRNFAIIEAVNEALEAAAQICDARDDSDAARWCAEDIRKLKAGKP